MKTRSLWVMWALVLLAADVGARPGGGSSFRSSSSSSSRSSSSSSSSFRSSRSSSSSYRSSGGSTYVASAALPPCVEPPAGAKPKGETWTLPDGTDAAAGTYCSPARMEVERQETGMWWGFLAFFVAIGFALVARVLRDQRQRNLARVPEVIAMALIGVPLYLGQSFGLVAIAWAFLWLFSRAQRVDAATTNVVMRGGSRADDDTSVALEKLQAIDPGFSRVVFLDFATAVYHAFYTWTGTAREASLGVFFLPVSLDEARRARGPGRFDQVVVGSLRVNSIALREARQRIVVEFESNVTRHVGGTRPRREVIVERWTFVRGSEVKSPTPDKLRVLTCPSCGAPVSVTDAGPCAHCGTVVQAGRMAWAVEEVRILSQEHFQTTGLGETVAEQGTSLPTQTDRRLFPTASAISGSEGAIPFLGAFAEQIVKPTFERMYAAWSTRRWSEARHLLGDRLWESQAFWVQQYADKGLTNRLEQLEVLRVEPVRAEQDRDVEAVTVRIFARGLDYTVDESGRTIGGDAKKPRAFSEYWVFVRTRGAKARPDHAALKCPNCGAPIDKLAAAGVCGYCDAKVTTGDHGWVLTQIIQDEVYAP